MKIYNKFQLELGAKPKKTRKSRPNRRERAKKAANEKMDAREAELALNCVESYFD
jgi:hypothetical protein